MKLAALFFALAALAPRSMECQSTSVQIDSAAIIRAMGSWPLHPLRGQPYSGLPREILLASFPSFGCTES